MSSIRYIRITGKLQKKNMAGKQTKWKLEVFNFKNRKLVYTKQTLPESLSSHWTTTTTTSGATSKSDKTHIVWVLYKFYPISREHGQLMCSGHPVPLVSLSDCTSGFEYVSLFGYCIGSSVTHTSTWALARVSDATTCTCNRPCIGISNLNLTDIFFSHWK